MDTVVTCPLCGQTMTEEEGRYICTGYHNHILSTEKELQRYWQGEKSMEWLKSRMKIRLGKLVHKR